MTELQILALLNSVLQAAPELLAAYQRLKSGTPVTDAEVQAIFNKWGLDRSTFGADIASTAS